MATSSAFAAGFDETQFRTAIRETMKMGMPENDAHKLRWLWKPVQGFEPDDPAGDPYDWTQDANPDDPGNPTEDPDTEGLIIDYAFNFSATVVGGEETPLGPVDPTKAVVTIFDVDYDRIKTADYCMIGTSRYNIRFDAAPYALFGVTMHDIHIEAEDQAASA